MPSFCAFSGARSPFVVMPFVFLNLDKMRNLCKSTHKFTVTQQSLRASEDTHIARPVPPPGPTRRKSSGIPCSSSSLLVDALHDGDKGRQNYFVRRSRISLTISAEIRARNVPTFFAFEHDPS